MCILATMLRTPLAMLRRASRFPQLKALAKELGVRIQRLNAVESGRDEASDEFLSALAKALGFQRSQVVAAYLEGRQDRLRTEVRAVEARLSDLRGANGRRSA